MVARKMVLKKEDAGDRDLCPRRFLQLPPSALLQLAGGAASAIVPDYLFSLLFASSADRTSYLLVYGHAY